MMMTMRLTVNGAPQEVACGINLMQLLDTLKIVGERVAVEVNLQIIGREQYQEVSLKEGDRVEIISFVGGGRA